MGLKVVFLKDIIRKMPSDQPNLQLVQFEAKDGIVLPGLLYSPKDKTNKVALYLHGNGSASIFYSPEKMNYLAKSLNKKQIAFFPFNNRGAHYIHKLAKTNKEEKKYGTALELIKDCIQDIDGAIDFLKQLGYRELYLIGSSTGANKIAVYHYYKIKNQVKKYILLSGGDDTGLYYEQLGPKRFKDMLAKCRSKIASGLGDQLIPEYLGGGIISYQSLYDTINPDGDYNIFPYNEYFNHLHLSKKNLFRELKTINRPTLVIYGEHDEYCYGRVGDCVGVLKKECSDKKLFTFEIIPDTNHRLEGKTVELANIICDWL